MITYTPNPTDLEKAIISKYYIRDRKSGIHIALWQRYNGERVWATRATNCDRGGRFSVSSNHASRSDAMRSVRAFFGLRVND